MRRLLRLKGLCSGNEGNFAYPRRCRHGLVKALSFTLLDPLGWRSLSTQTRTGRGVENGKLLEHHHLIRDDNASPYGITSYAAAEVLQELCRNRFLEWKGLTNQERAALNVPRPQLISFESTPTFTLGRRQEDLTPGQSARLCRDIHVSLPHRRHPLDKVFTPQVVKTNRGGLTTYHGPGQLILWPVIDMHSPLYASYGVASYAGHLEATTQRLLFELFGIETYINRDEPGVWVRGGTGKAPRKIAALGVHHRRYVTALGIAVNIDVPVVGPEEVNPWARFVPCGLEGKLVTSVEAELATRHRNAEEAWTMRGLAECWTTIFERGLRDASWRMFREATGESAASSRKRY